MPASKELMDEVRQQLEVHGRSCTMEGRQAKFLVLDGSWYTLYLDTREVMVMRDIQIVSRKFSADESSISSVLVEDVDLVFDRQVPVPLPESLRVTVKGDREDGNENDPRL